MPRPGGISKRHLRRLVNRDYSHFVNSLISSHNSSSQETSAEQACQNTPRSCETSCSRTETVFINNHDQVDANQSIGSNDSDVDDHENLENHSDDQSDRDEHAAKNLMDFPTDSEDENVNEIDENPFVLDSSDHSIDDILVKIRQWCISYKITHVAIKELLSILSEITGLDDGRIPKDPRTFLSTPRETEVRVVVPGLYHHVGIKKAIQQQYDSLRKTPQCDVIEVAINIDGLPVSKSSGSQLYPILCINKNLKFANVTVVGVYHGYEKPSNYNDLLQDFVNEAVNLTENGIEISGQKYKFKIMMFLFDAVAKAGILCIKGHSGYFSCSKCTLEGVYDDRVYFPETTFVKMTHDCFLLQSCPEHHTGRTILEQIPDIDLVQDVPLDYMHLICLGVVKKFLVNTWCFGRPPHKLRNMDVKLMSDKLVSLKEHMPSDFARRPRSVMESKRWKATEFRQFLLYSGPVVLKSILPKQKYDHFLTLHVAITILISDKFHAIYLDYAEKLLKHFVETTKTLYAEHFLSHNIHNLLHIADDVRRFGCLENFSNFSSENYLQFLKKLLRKPGNVLPQIVRRITEINAHAAIKNHITEMKDFQMKHACTNGILIDECNSPQFKSIVFEKFTLSTNLTRDSCCMLHDNTIIIIENFAFCTKINNFVIIGRSFTTKKDFFLVPCRSSLLNIFLVEDLSELHYWSVTLIKGKVVKLPYNDDSFICMPLLHTTL